MNNVSLKKIPSVAIPSQNNSKVNKEENENSFLINNKKKYNLVPIALPFKNYGSKMS